MTIALVTGAASGIGQATARRLADDGAAALVLVDVDENGLHAMAADLGRRGANVLTRVHDVADEAAWAETEQAIRMSFGGLDRAVVNAGVADSGPITEMPFDAWRRVLSVNLDGAFLTLRCALRLLREGGAAVVVSSAAAVKAEPGIAAYSASKAGVLQLSRVAAKEAAARGVRVNAILPDGVETPIWRGAPGFQALVAEAGSERAAFDRMAAMATPLGRYAKPEAIAAQIAFLLSPDACGETTGAALLTDGGYTL